MKSNPIKKQKAPAVSKRTRAASQVRQATALEKDIVNRLHTPGMLIGCAELAIWLRRPHQVIVSRITKHPTFPKPVPGTDGKGQSALYLSEHLLAWASRAESRED